MTVQDTKISSLERNLRELEDEVQMLKSSGLLQPDGQQGELKLEAESYKSHSRFMKTKVETCRPMAGHQAGCLPASTSACEGALHCCCMLLHVA